MEGPETKNPQLRGFSGLGGNVLELELVGMDRLNKHRNKLFIKEKTKFKEKNTPKNTPILIALGAFSAAMTV